MGDKFVRSSSGVWKVDDSKPAAVPAAPAVATTTPPRGLTASGGKGDAFLALARADVARGNLASAETNFRLALTMKPNDPQVLAELREVTDKRDAERRARGPMIR